MMRVVSFSGFIQYWWLFDNLFCSHQGQVIKFNELGGLLAWEWVAFGLLGEEKWLLLLDGHFSTLPHQILCR